MITLLVVDDKPSIRRGLRMQLELEDELRVVGEAADGEEAVELAQKLKPDVVLMDIVMPGVDGIAATRRLHDAGLPSAVLILSLHDDADTRARARAAGAVAFVTKCETGPTLLAAIRAAGHLDA